MGGGIEAQMEELFAVVEGVSLRRMFGGLGIFRRGVMFALVVNDVLHLKADETTQQAYAAEGSGPWIYQGRHRAATQTSYWRLPERLYDEPDEFRDWALAAFAVAERTAKQKKPSTRKPPVRAKPSANKPAAKRAAKKPPGKRPASRTPSEKKTAAKKAPARKPKPRIKPGRKKRG